MELEECLNVTKTREIEKMRELANTGTKKWEKKKKNKVREWIGRGWPEKVGLLENGAFDEERRRKGSNDWEVGYSNPS